MNTLLVITLVLSLAACNGEELGAPPKASPPKAPTTTPKAPTTTPKAPTTTPKAPTTTPKAPTTAAPTVDPTKLNFRLQDAKNKTCIYLYGKINIEMLINDKKNKTTHTHALTKTDANMTGSCPSGNGTKTSRLSLAWGKSLTVVFTFNQTTDLWFLSGLVVQASDQKSKKTLMTGSHKYGPGENSGLFQAKLGFSYSCSTDKKLVLESPKNTSYTITVDFVSVRMQPFQGKPFDKDFTCPGKDHKKKPGSMVPIAVGGALAGLIVIVLIAYLIGRRKANRGYQKV